MAQKLNNIFVLRKDDIQSALKAQGRQYFIGDLKRPQQLEYMNLGDLEVGSTLYQQVASDTPHYHSKSSEIIYVLRGCYKILIISENIEYSISEGDFVVLPPNTAYVGKAAVPNTQTFFIKAGGNDKITVASNEQIQSWVAD